LTLKYAIIAFQKYKRYKASLTPKEKKKRHLTIKANFSLPKRGKGLPTKFSKNKNKKEMIK